MEEANDAKQNIINLVDESIASKQVQRAQLVSTMALVQAEIALKRVDLINLRSGEGIFSFVLRKVDEKIFDGTSGAPKVKKRKYSAAMEIEREIKTSRKFDSLDQWPVSSEIKKGECGTRSAMRCEKYDVALHLKCFKKFHTK